VPNRGKRNEPSWVPHTIGRLAAARGLSPEVIAAQTSENARRLFGLA
jgi:TatD DNase family protein